MEQRQLTADRRTVRAARSLYTNRRRQATIEARIDRATAALEAYLALAGQASATIGAYEIALFGGQLVVERVEPPDGRQLPLPEFGQRSDAVLEGRRPDHEAPADRNHPPS